MTFHEDRLISALNKYWRPLTKEEYFERMDLIDVNNAVAVAQFPKPVTEWVWERKKTPFEVTSG